MVYLAPSAEMKPGQRTGKFRLGSDQLLVDASGHSRISVQDYAVAMIDELEYRSPYSPALHGRILNSASSVPGCTNLTSRYSVTVLWAGLIQRGEILWKPSRM